MASGGHQTLAYDERMRLEALAAFVTSRVKASRWTLHRAVIDAAGRAVALDPADAIEAGVYALEDPVQHDWHILTLRGGPDSCRVQMALLKPGTQVGVVLDALSSSGGMETIKSQAQLALSTQRGPSGWKASLFTRGHCTGLLKAVYDHLTQAK